MGRLLTMTGNQIISNNSIEAVFKEKLNITAGSKIALRSLKYDLIRPIPDVIEIVAGVNTYNVNGDDVIIAPGNYTINNPGNSLTTALNVECNYQAGPDAVLPTNGIDYNVEIDGGTALKHSCTVYNKLGPVTSSPTTWVNWVTATGTPDLSVSGLFDADGSVDDVSVYSVFKAPRHSHSLRLDLVAVDEFECSIAGWFTIGIRNVAGTNRYFYKTHGDAADVVLDASVPDINDSLRFDKTGAAVTVQIASTTPDNQLVDFVLVTRDTQAAYNINYNDAAFYYFSITAPAGSNAEFNSVFTVADVASAINNTLTITVPSAKLARLFGTDQDPSSNTGNPATITFANPISTDTDSGVRLCLTGLRVASHVGDTRIAGQRGSDGCIQVLYSDTGAYDQMLLDPIDIVGTGELEKLTLTFRDEVSGTPLAFNDTPSAVLMIYDK